MFVRLVYVFACLLSVEFRGPGVFSTCLEFLLGYFLEMVSCTCAMVACDRAAERYLKIPIRCRLKR